jgi:hypothetical protein
MFQALTAAAEPTHGIAVWPAPVAGTDWTCSRLPAGNHSTDTADDLTCSVGAAIRAGQSAHRFRNVSSEHPLGIGNGDTDFVAVRK